MKKIFGNKSVIVALAAVGLGLVAGAVLILAIGQNPLEAYTYMFGGGLKSVERIGNSLATATTLILTGLCVSFAFRTGLFNIGGAGQMLIGGLCATLVALYVPLPKPLILPIMIVVAMLGGAIWGGIPGFLKAKFNVHEVVATIMTNWIAFWAIDQVIKNYLKGNLETESRLIPSAASLKVDWLTKLFEGSYINLGLIIAVLAVLIVAFILNRTVLGYELKAVGFNRHSAEYAGIKVNRNIVLSMMISGALAGLAGLTFYCGYASNMQIGSLPSQGYDGIAVALLGANNPFGVMVAALFFGILQSGKGFMSAMIPVPPDLADTIIATVIYFAATSVLFERVWDYFKRRKAAKGGAKADVVAID